MHQEIERDRLDREMVLSTITAVVERFPLRERARSENPPAPGVA